VLPSTAERVTSTLGRLGEVVVLHDPSVPLDRASGEAVARALRLTTENARLQAEALEQLAELRASRRRLALARGRQRAVLARRLREGAERRLADIDSALDDARPSTTAVAEIVDSARGLVGEAREGIALLARGLQPPVLAQDGLGGALPALAANSPVPISLTVADRRFDAAVEHAAYLVCSEALANVAKHAAASSVRLWVGTEDGHLQLRISDDGCGGADRRGSGLRGLDERVEELGGTLRIDSPSGRGTHLVVEIPLGGDRREREARGLGVSVATPGTVEVAP
jgi:signal transduction histidine kinase